MFQHVHAYLKRSGLDAAPPKGRAAAPGGRYGALRMADMPAAPLTLGVGHASDPAEFEADQVADRVMAMAPQQRDFSALPVHARRSEGGNCSPAAAGACPQCREAAGARSAAAEAAVRSLGPGMPLPAPERAFFEPRFGRDLSHVRVHDRGSAHSAARALNARAFTLGSDIAFAAGEYRPGTTGGRHLLAHELTHSLQPGAGNTLRRFSYGNHAGVARHFSDGSDFVNVPVAHRGGANGLDAANTLIDTLIARTDWRGNRCRTVFTASALSGETLAEVHARAVMWFNRNAPAGDLAGSELSTNDLGYTQELFDVRSRWALAASILHEYLHLAGQPDHGIGDAVKGACGLPNI